MMGLILLIIYISCFYADDALKCKVQFFLLRDWLDQETIRPVWI